MAKVVTFEGVSSSVAIGDNEDNEDNGDSGGVLRNYNKRRGAV